MIFTKVFKNPEKKHFSGCLKCEHFKNCWNRTFHQLDYLPAAQSTASKYQSITINQKKISQRFLKTAESMVQKQTEKASRLTVCT